MDKRILIAYAGMYSSTADVAEVIGQQLRRCGALVEACPAKDVVELNSYDAAIIGSAIRYCKWLPDAVKFVQTYREILSRMPVAYFLTCVDLTRVPEEMIYPVSLFIDPGLGNSPSRKDKLNMWEQMHLLSRFMNSVFTKAPQVRPVSIAVFKGKLNFNQLRFVDWLPIRLGAFITKRISEGDFRNWDTIRVWAASLYPMLLQQGEVQLRKEPKEYEY